MIEWFFHQVSQALGILALIGVMAAAIRWKNAVRRDLLLAFAIYLLGSSIRESVVYYYGGQNWDETALLLSGLSRVIQLGGVTLFIWAAVREHCPAWSIWALLGVVLALVAVV